MHLTVEQHPVRFHTATRDHAAGMVEVIHAAFGARPALDPPSTAIDETPQTVAAAIEPSGGVYVTVDDRPAGSLIIAPRPTDTRPTDAGLDNRSVAVFQRVSVHPDFQQHGIASAMIGEAELRAAEAGYDTVEIYARKELPELISYWQHRGFTPVRRDAHGQWMAQQLPIRVAVPDADAMRGLGARLAGTLRAGDVIIMSGPLGAGKTTLTQGIGRGLDSAGAIISPTFVLSRIHPSASGRAALVHVDAYRLGSSAELDDLGLDADLDRSVTVVEWGEELAESLAESRLEIVIERPEPAGSGVDPIAVERHGTDRHGTDRHGTDRPGTGRSVLDHGSDDDHGRPAADDRVDEPRTVWIETVGPRWTEPARGELVDAVRDVAALGAR